jgi:hypothetical protein
MIPNQISLEITDSPLLIDNAGPISDGPDFIQFPKITSQNGAFLALSFSSLCSQTAPELSTLLGVPVNKSIDARTRDLNAAVSL